MRTRLRDGATAVAFGSLYVAWLANSAILLQPALLLGFAVLAGYGLWAMRRGRSLGPTALLSTGASLLLLATLAWNSVFYFYIWATGYDGDIFRGFMRTRHAPVYGHAALPRSSLAVAVPVLLGLFFRRSLDMLRRSRSPRDALEIAAWLLLLMVAFALSDGPPRLLQPVGHYFTFALDVPRFAGAGDMLSRFVASMPEMSVHNAHYPPGNLLLLSAMTWWGVPELGRVVVLAAAAGTVFWIGGIARLLGFTYDQRLAAQLLYAASPGVLILPSLALTPLFMFVVAAAIFFLLHALSRGSVVSAVLLGVTVSVATLVSFSIATAGFWIVVFSLGSLRLGLYSVARVTSTALIAFLVNVAFLVGFAVFTGFDVVACFESALEHNQSIMSGAFDSLIRYLIRSTGNLLDYLLLLGAPQALLFCAAALQLSSYRNRGDVFGLFTMATLLTLLVASFSGLYFLETGRIWIYLTPPMSLVAARAVAAFGERHGQALASCVAFALAMALALEFALTTVPWRQHLGGLP